MGGEPLSGGGFTVGAAGPGGWSFALARLARDKNLSVLIELRNCEIFTYRFWNQICTGLSAIPILLLSSRRSVEVGERSLLNAFSSCTSCSGVTRLRLRRSISSKGAFKLITVSGAAFDLRVRLAPDEGSTVGGSLRGGVCLRAGPSGESVSGVSGCDRNGGGKKVEDKQTGWLGNIEDI